MLRHILVLASCLVLHPGLATGWQAAGDPISGLWGSRQGAGLDLKFDGRSAVTGTIYITGNGSAPIESGSFNPSTRALKLSGRARGADGTTAPFNIDGTVDGDVGQLQLRRPLRHGDVPARRQRAAAGAGQRRRARTAQDVR